MNQRGHHRPADPAALVAGVNVHLGDLERVTQPGLRQLTSAGCGQRAAHQVVPPLAAGPVEAVREPDDGEPVPPGLRPQLRGRVPGIVRQGHGHAAERGEVSVPFHDRPPTRQLVLRGLHRGRVDVDQDAQFREEACLAEFQQLRASAHPRKRTRALPPGRAPDQDGTVRERPRRARGQCRTGGHGVLSDPPGTFELRYQ